MPRIIVEHTFDPPLSDEEHHRIAARVDVCLEAHGARWVATYLAHDKRRMICEFDAPDAEAVRASLRSADASFDRVWSTTVYRRGEPDLP